MLTRRQIWRRTPSRDASYDIPYNNMMISPLMRSISKNVVNKTVIENNEFYHGLDGYEEDEDKIIDDNTENSTLTVEIDDLYISTTCDPSTSSPNRSYQTINQNNIKQKHVDEISNNKNNNTGSNHFRRNKFSNFTSESTDSICSSSCTTSICSETTEKFKRSSPKKVRFHDTVKVVRIPTRRRLIPYLQDLYWNMQECDYFKREAFQELSTYAVEHNCTLQQAVVSLFQNNENDLYTISNRTIQLDLCLETLSYTSFSSSSSSPCNSPAYPPSVTVTAIEPVNALNIASPMIKTSTSHHHHYNHDADNDSLHPLDSPSNSPMPVKRPPLIIPSDSTTTTTRQLPLPLVTITPLTSLNDSVTMKLQKQISPHKNDKNDDTINGPDSPNTNVTSDLTEISQVPSIESDLDISKYTKSRQLRILTSKNSVGSEINETDKMNLKIINNDNSTSSSSLYNSMSSSASNISIEYNDSDEFPSDSPCQSEKTKTIPV